MVIVAILDGLDIARWLALFRGLPPRAETSRIGHRFGGKGLRGGWMKLFPAVEANRAHNLLKLEGDTMNDARKLASTHIGQG
jgi:hypothetical protein